MEKVDIGWETEIEDEVAKFVNACPDKDRIIAIDSLDVIKKR